MLVSLKIVKGLALAAPPRVRRDVGEAVERTRRIAGLRPPLPTALRLALAPRLRVLCHPAVPSHHQVLYKVCAAMGWRIVVDPDAAWDVAFHTMKTRGACALPEDRPVVNRRCVDVSKGHVAETFERIFGYPLAVDPTTHDGPIVEKSDDNSAHDGRVLRGPLAPGEIRPGRVYQRLIDATRGERAVDLRTPMMGGQVPIVIEKRRPIARRFENFQDVLLLHEPEEAFSADERDKLGRLARALGLDFGEVDALRDRDGRLYVVDVNNRPAGPAKELRADLKRRAFDRMVPRLAAVVEGLLAGDPAPGRGQGGVPAAASR